MSSNWEFSKNNKKTILIGIANVVPYIHTGVADTYQCSYFLPWNPTSANFGPDQHDTGHSISFWQFWNLAFNFILYAMDSLWNWNHYWETLPSCYQVTSLNIGNILDFSKGVNFPTYACYLLEISSMNELLMDDHLSSINKERCERGKDGKVEKRGRDRVQ